MREVVHAAVHRNHRTGDVTGQRRGEECHQRRHFFRLTEAPDRDVTGDERASASSVGCRRSRICGLLIRPGAMAFTVMPCPATSDDSPLLHRCSAAFAAVAAFTERGSIEPLKLITRPHPCACIAGSSAWVSRRAAEKFSANASSQIESAASTVVGREPPAALTRMSTRCNAASDASAMRRTSPASVTSPSRMIGAGAPAASIPAASACSGACRRDEMATRTPCAASCLATAAPMPLPAPVTSAVRPSRFNPSCSPFSTAGGSGPCSACCLITRD